MDAIKNLSYGTVLTAPSPADSGTSLVLGSGQGARFPDPATEGAFNVVVWPSGVIPLSSNAEIVRVTARSTDTLTITRTQESTSARTIIVGDQVALTITKKTIDDIVDLINSDWRDIDATLTYSSASLDTFVATTSTDLTTLIQPGMKIKLTQTTPKYFYVTAIDASTITLFGGDSYDLVSATITTPQFSALSAPIGFPKEENLWSYEATDVNLQTVASPTQNLWINVGSVSLTYQIGCWKAYYSVAVTLEKSGGTIQGQATLSTANNSESDVDFTTRLEGSELIGTTLSKEKVLVITSATPYYLNTRTTTASVTNLYNTNSLSKAVIRATLTYNSN